MKPTTDTIAEIKVSYKPTKQAGPKITSSQLAYEYLRQLYDEETVAFQEQFIIPLFFKMWSRSVLRIRQSVYKRRKQKK